MHPSRLALFALSLAAAAHAQTVTTPPQSHAVVAGAAATFTVAATGPALSYQWQHDGVAIPGATAATLTVPAVQPADAGLYTVIVSSGPAIARASAALGLATTARTLGTVAEVGSDIRHPNGNTYDQFLLTGPAATIRADPGQISRISFVDLDDDIVQVEFAGAGTLTLVLDSATPPAPPLNYNQPSVAYVKGHAHLTVAGADETTNLSIFTVGTLTAVNPALFKPGVAYDGVAGLASLALISPTGRFGGVRAADAEFFAAAGLAGIFAPGVRFDGPVLLGDLRALDAAVPVLLLGSAADVRIAGGSLFQPTAQPISTSGFDHLAFVDGTTSHGLLLPAQANRARLEQNGLDATDRLLVLPAVTVAATQPTADESGANPGEFTLTRSGGTAAPLTVAYSIAGTAAGGTDYTAGTGTIAFPIGASTAKIPVAPRGDLATEPAESVVLTVAPGATYTLGSTATATVQILDTPPTLFLTSLRPTATAASSTASGTATVLLSPDGTFANVSLSFSNLSSAETVAYLRLGDPGEVGTELLRLAGGQVDATNWSIVARGPFSAADILQALRAGRVFVSLETTNFPSGELRGAFATSAGSQVFVVPPAVPAPDLSNVTDTDAARFLLQATFGPTTADLAALKQQGYAAWFAAQFAAPISLHRDATLADFAANNAGGQNAVNGVNTRPGSVHRQAAWWRIALRGPDQLRQRVAFALSEIFVISDVNGTVNNNQEGAANYYDLLAHDAFGNFRTLLEDVTLSPMMGVYLSHLRNARATSPTGAQPDENYGREVMQLFSIGLNRLQPDGTLQLNASALPIPTYDQATVTAMARVFTGWAFHNANPTNQNFRNSPQNFIDPMTLYAGYHDTAAKTIVGGLVLPASQTGTQDLAATLDALFRHPNTGPFLCRQLIQRLVTSNPSPGYVYRVAQVFADNGSGVRGDLGAVVRAILTDYEARSPAVIAHPGFGKLKEPLLRLTGLLRAAAVTSATGRYAIANANGPLAQTALSAPTVFNFFEPDFVLPGPLAAAGLRAPEFQILTATSAISTPNYLYNFIYNATYQTVSLDFTDLLPFATQPGPLVDRLSLLLCGNGLAPATRTRLVSALGALPTATSAADRVRHALYLVATSADAAVQR